MAVSPPQAYFLPSGRAGAGTGRRLGREAGEQAVRDGGVVVKITPEAADEFVARVPEFFHLRTVDSQQSALSIHQVDADRGVFEQVLELAAARGDLSRAGILAASRATGPVALGGIGSTIDYSQPVRLANAKTTIFNVDNSYRNAIRVLAREYGSPAAAAYRR